MNTWADKKRRIRVLYLIDECDLGGTERQLVLLARELAASGYEVAIACLRLKGEMAARAEAEGIEVLACGKRRKVDVRMFGRLVGLMRRFQPHIVHTYLVTANLWGGLASLMTRAPCLVLSERNVSSADDGGDGLAARIVWTLLSRRADRVVVNARAIGDYLVASFGVEAEKIAVIYNGIEALRPPAGGRGNGDQGGRQPEEPRLPRVGVLCRLVPRKNLPLFLDSLRRLIPLVPSFEAIIGGDGPERAALEEAVTRLALSGRVRFVGRVTDPLAFFGGCDLAVLPSASEGFPNVLMEAMLCRRPVVATAVGGVPELVLHERTGLLVPPSDPDSLAGAMGVLLADPARARRMGEEGYRRVVSSYTVGRMTGETEALYREVLARKAPEVLVG